jgi:ATP-binding cassette, subfamily B, bacterial
VRVPAGRLKRALEATAPLWFHVLMADDAQDPAEDKGRKPSLAGTRRIFPRVARLFRPYKGRLAIVAIGIVVSSGLGVVTPLLVKQVFDDALFCGPECPKQGLLWQLVGAMAIVAATSSAIGYGQAYLGAQMGQRVMRDLRQSLYEHLQRMPLRFLTATKTGEIQSRLTSDIGGVDEIVTYTAANSFANVVILVSSVVAMLVLSWELTLVSMGVVPLFAWISFRIGRRGHGRWKAASESRAELTAMAEETLSISGILLGKTFGRQREAIRRFRDENERLARFQFRAQMNGRAFWALVGTFFALGPALVFVVAAWQLSSGSSAVTFTAGTIVAFTALQNRMFWPVGELFDDVVHLLSSFALFERVFEYLDLQPDLADAPGAVAVPREALRGRITLRDVRFRYEGAVDGRPWTLDGIDLEIQPGQLAALVGPTGAGKTTLSYLLPRLYDVQAGAVEIDNRDVRGITLQSLADSIGVVTQETFLFHASVRDNLLYAKPDATQDELEAAARTAFIHARILELPEGYETKVGERGYRLSGGEKQRLAIARALLKDPRILILDEATSSLDSASERIVHAALRPLMQGRTTLAIAHRLSTIVAADVIFVLDRGRLVERGRHADLVRLGGVYAELYEHQFGGGLIEARTSDGMVLSSGEIVGAELAAREPTG